MKSELLRKGELSLKRTQPLRLVDAPPYYCEEVKLWDANSEDPSHSLHHVLFYPDAFRAEIPAFLIKRYSKRGATVLDPFCGSGTTGLEANMAGRVAFLSDINPLAVAISRPKLNPSELAEVTLGLQLLALRRPVEMGPFNEIFKHFYDAETFREIVNLRSALAGKDDAVSDFTRLIALSLLHGSSAGYFSAYSASHAAVTPQQQRELNKQRGQVADYRSVLPRILRKTASVLRDGVPSIMRQITLQNRVYVSDARNLSHLASGSVDLVVTAPPMPSVQNNVQEQWLRLWFLGVPAQSLADKLWCGNDIGDWLNFMNEVLMESARVARAGGRAAFVISEKDGADHAFINMVQTNLSRYWQVECLLTHSDRIPQIGAITRSRKSVTAQSDTKMIVLRRQ